MENFFSRYKNPLVLMAVLFIQVVALATQVKRTDSGKPGDSGGTRLIRVWTVDAITPFERAFVFTGGFLRRNFRSYIDLHDARRENRELQQQIDRLKMEQVSLRQDAEQAHRLQALLSFKETYIGKTLAAQVIGTSGTEESRVIYLDKGSRDGVKVDMPVITPDGIVGKIKDVFSFSSQVLLINDRDSGAGVILQNSRLQSILRGSPQGELRLNDIMSDEKVNVGELVVTSGGDRIYPKGLPVGTITSVTPDRENESLLVIKLKPAADLNRLEEVLIVKNVVEETPSTDGSTAMRAADILAQRLPSVDKREPVTKPPAAASPAPGPPSHPPAPAQTGSVNPAGENKPPAGKITPSVAPGARQPGDPAVKKAVPLAPNKGGVGANSPNTVGGRPSPAINGAGKPTPTPSGQLPGTAGAANPAVPKAKPAATPAKKPASQPTPAGSASPGPGNGGKPDGPETGQPPANSTEKPPR